MKTNNSWNWDWDVRVCMGEPQPRDGGAMAHVIIKLAREGKGKGADLAELGAGQQHALRRVRQENLGQNDAGVHFLV